MKKRLTKVQKRMLILRDAVKQIKIGFLSPEHAGVCNVPGIEHENKETGAKEILLKLKKAKKKCQVCARGSLLLASVQRFNQYSALQLESASDDASFWQGSETDGKLMKFFSAKQIQMMETAFEKACNYTLLGEVLYNKCERFGEKYRSPKNRLLAILENAIKNKGIFIP